MMGRTQDRHHPAVFPPTARSRSAGEAAVWVQDAHMAPLFPKAAKAGLQAPGIAPADAGRGGDDAVERVFQTAAELFSVLATPLRLRIIHAICDGERTVRDIVAAVHSSQPNISQHLRVLYQAGIVARRRDSNWIYYRVDNPKAIELCRAVCTQIAIELRESGGLPASERLGMRWNEACAAGA